MSSRQPRIASVFASNPLIVMDRVEGAAAANVVQADVTTPVTLRVWQHDTREDAINAANGTEVGAVANIAVVDCIFDTLQTDARWTENGGDAEGYNFRATIPAARFPTGGKWNRAQLLFNPSASGEDDFRLVWVIEVKPIDS